MKSYAGVGSRETPDEVLHWMTWAARALRAQGWTLSSGHADGADLAFEAGAEEDARIYLPWPGYNREYPIKGWHMDRPDVRARNMAQEVHSNWYTMGSGGRALHARNAHILFGQHLVEPVRFVLCWTESGHRRGGTGTTMRMADNANIEVLNMWHPAVQERIEHMVSDYADTNC